MRGETKPKPGFPWIPCAVGYQIFFWELRASQLCRAFPPSVHPVRARGRSNLSSLLPAYVKQCSIPAKDEQMQPAFCHASQWNWSVIHKIIFINPPFCSENQPNKTPYPTGLPGICCAVGSSTRIPHMVLRTWWYRPSSRYSVWVRDSVPPLTRRGYKLFWSQIRIIIQTRNGKNISQFKLHTDRS